MTPLTSEQRTLAIGLVMGVTLVAFEMTAVITALPTISDELGGESLYGVALAAYTLADVVALVAAGELADRRGPTLPYALRIAANGLEDSVRDDATLALGVNVIAGEVTNPGVAEAHGMTLTPLSAIVAGLS